ncbi:hypothetical protein BJX63DRAFT_109799 [Aspergillus granulosus]|uniref:F-box domain-containing protein n=1 Tax=Aspergillus granulosus TaxID=176169 RepID=A0ABR4HRK3_9EURO
MNKPPPFAAAYVCPPGDQDGFSGETVDVALFDRLLSSETNPQPLLALPNEILLRIFHQLDIVKDACSLAQSCSHLHTLFIMDRSRILRSAANVPLKPDYGLVEAFSDLVRRSPSNWIFRCSYVINLDRYPEVEHIDPYGPTVWDLFIFQPQQLTFQDTLMEFLSRFLECDPRLQDHYGGGVTLDILLAAAQLQADILRDSSTNETDLSGNTTIIALALRCFLDCHILNNIGLDCYGRPQDSYLPEDGSSVKVIIAPNDNKPFLTATAYEEKQRERLHTPAKTPGCHFESDLCTMLGSLARLSFQLLDEQDPQHWPTVLYVLLILRLIRDSLFYCPAWMIELYNAGEILERLFQDLARYYYICTEGGQILTYRWTKENYGLRVGHCQTAVEHAGILHDLWLDGDEEGQWNSRERYRGLEGFPCKLGEFVDGDFRRRS